MEAKDAVTLLQQAEKMKSALIIGINLFDQLLSLKDDEFTGGRKVFVWYLEGLLKETRVAESALGTIDFKELEKKVMEVIGRVQVSQFQETRFCLSEAISLATTACQRSLSVLAEKGLA